MFVKKTAEEIAKMTMEELGVYVVAMQEDYEEKESKAKAEQEKLKTDLEKSQKESLAMILGTASPKKEEDEERFDVNDFLN